MSLMAQIDRLKGQWDRRMRTPVDELDLGGVNEEFAISDEIERLGERLDAEENPHGPRFHSSQWSYLSDEQRRRLVDLRVRADWLTSASHGDPRKRLKMKRELRRHKVDPRDYDWNNMTFKEIEELMREHGLRVSSRVLMAGRVASRLVVGKVITCDRPRRTPEGESFWQRMMEDRKKVSEREFLRRVDIEDVLDDGESWEDYKEVQAMQGDPVKFFRSGDTYFFQTAGFEFIWLTRADERRLR